MIGFAAALRRSELAAIQVEDLSFTRNGLVLAVPYSKTDQERKGRKVAIPEGSVAFCPIRALRAWLEIAELTAGPVFRKVDRFGNIGSRALHASAVGEILRKRMAAAGIDPKGYSAHSLRAGLVTSAAKAGVPGWKIRQQTGHKSDTSLARYIRDQQIFENNAAAAIFAR
jgi:integrase